MSIATYSIQNRVVSWMFVLLLFIGGASSFFGLGQLEFPEFSIKEAMVITSYPGASPEQVEEEVTLPLEEKLQQMGQIKHLESINSAGLSQIQIEVHDTYSKHDLPQVWDELRNKIADAQVDLPEGANSSLVQDDFGDVYGYLFNLTGNGFSYRELEKYTDVLRRDLTLIPGVRKVSVLGAPEEEIVVEINQQTLTSLGMSPDYLFAHISAQNVVSNAGQLRLKDNKIRIHPTGEFSAVRDVEQLMVSPAGSAAVVRLGDIAKVYKATEESPSLLYRSNGLPAISIGISFLSGVNVVDTSALVRDRIDALAPKMPLGMNLQVAYDQGALVDDAVSGFLVNLAQAVGIVIAVLLIFMGVRSGLLMGAILLLNILGTFIIMKFMGLQLQLISLGALIIALGMLVDNAIVITEGVLIGLQKGKTRLKAAQEVVAQTQWPLLGATVIAIVAFAPIGLSQDATGEFAGSLFWVLCISLFISWILALTITPFFCNLLFKDGTANEGESAELYQGWFYNGYRAVLTLLLKHRIATVVVVLLMLVASMTGMQKVKMVFFPPSNTPIVLVDIWMPEGTDIYGTQKQAQKIESAMSLRQQNQDYGLINITTVIGQGSQRFVLPYTPEKGYTAYAQLVINMASLEEQQALVEHLADDLRLEFPEAEYRVQILDNGPSPAAKLEARFYGEDPQVLRSLAAQAELIMRNQSDLSNVRHSWRNQVPVIRPEFDLVKAARVGISKSSMDDALQMAFDGIPVATYREGSQVINVLARAPESERLNPESLRKLQIWSDESNEFVPITQVVNHIGVEWENPIIYRRDRKRMITVMSDPVLSSGQTADAMLKSIRDDIEAIELPTGYELEWGGEYETAGDAQKALESSIPIGVLVMFMITVFLFNSVRQPIIIWLTVPLCMIGVSTGLLLLNAPMSFMAILGVLSLSGMIIKNGIVLVDQINLELKNGAEPYRALFDSTLSRVRPVAMAAITTVLGMIPLVSNPFFSSMAITIIFGLSFATLCTLLVLPVCYSLIYRIKAN